MTKKEQLKQVFNTLLLQMLTKLVFDVNVTNKIVTTTVDETSKLLLKEVSIRTDLK